MSNAAKKDLSLSTEGSLLAIIMLAIQADGVFSLAEKEVVRFTVQQIKIFREYSQEELVQKMEESLKAIAENGEEVVLKSAVEGLPAQLYNTAFTIAADLITANDKITKNESDTLNKIQKALAIPEDTADKIIEVMKYKNYHYD